MNDFPDLGRIVVRGLGLAALSSFFAVTRAPQTRSPTDPPRLLPYQRGPKFLFPRLKQHGHRMKTSKKLMFSACLLAPILLLSAQASHAASATWNLNPNSGDWNTAANWTPATVPGAAADTATFDLSNTSGVYLSANTQVNGIVFNAGASAFTITASPMFQLTISGMGITNNSGIAQDLVAAVDGSGNRGSILFKNSANAGSGTFFTNNGGIVSGSGGGATSFENNSSAGNSTFTCNGGTVNGAFGGVIYFGQTSTAGNGIFTNNGSVFSSPFSGGGVNFSGTSTAGNGTFINNGGTVSGTGGGSVDFGDSATAGFGIFTNNGGTVSGAYGSGTFFFSTSSAGSGTFTINGGAVSGAYGTAIEFMDTSTAGSGTFITNGGAVSGAFNGEMTFRNGSTAGSAILIAHGGLGGSLGAYIRFTDDATGCTARVEVFDNGNLDISYHNAPGLTTGSIEGSGAVFLGAYNLTVGRNSFATTFSGVIQDGGANGGSGGSFTKIGAGTLTLSGTNTYTGPTTINAGKLSVDGLITSIVTVNGGGSLGGLGTTGSVTVSNGGVVAPGGQQTLNINGNYTQNAGGLLKIGVAGTNPSLSDHLHVTGNATLAGTLEITFQAGFLPHTGDVFKLLQIDGAVSGSFSSITFRGVDTGFQVQAQFVSGFFQLTALNDATPAPAIISPLSVTTVVGQQFIYQIVSTPNATVYTASALPAGLSINPAIGIISGTPTQAGTSQIILSASATSGIGTASLVLTIQPRPSTGPVIISSTSVTGRTGRAFQFQALTMGGSGATRLMATGLPAGLVLDSVTGVISGTATSAGSSAATLTVADCGASTTATLQLTFTSDPAVPVIISPSRATLSSGEPFSYTIVAPSSDDPAAFTLVGTLPAGLSFNPQAGTISGTYSGPLGTDIAGGAVLGSIQLFGSNSHGTSTIELRFRAPPAGAVNIATRLLVGTGENVLIGGFIVTGDAPKVLLVRAIGPSLTNFGVPNALSDPTLRLQDSANHVTVNDNWRDTQEQFILETGLPPTDNRESAIVAGLDPGNYTAIVEGHGGATGIALVEVYDLGTASVDGSGRAKLGDISTRGFVDTGDNVMIGGFIIQRVATKVVVRAIGPSLSAFGVNGALPDPTLELKNSSGSTLIGNDDWQQGQAAEIQQAGLAPNDPHESAVVATLPPGLYTAIVSGKGGATGLALVEVYALE